jgi:hypothetical protein
MAETKNFCLELLLPLLCAGKIRLGDREFPCGLTFGAADFSIPFRPSPRLFVWTG